MPVRNHPPITAAPPAGAPRARHHRPGGPPGPAVATLLRRTGLPVPAAVQEETTQEGQPRQTLRAAGLPMLIAAMVAGGPGWTTYLVRDGDSLSGIARRHGTDVRALTRVNQLTDPDVIRTGSSLAVPLPPAADRTPTRRRAAASGLHPVDDSGAPALTYRVRPGDTISEIAARSGCSVRAVLAANGLRPKSLIRPGQLIVLPSLSGGASGTSRPRRPATRPVVHVVRPGDTVWEISRRHRVELGAVLAANRMRAGDVLRPGRKLVLPGARPRPARPVGTTSAHVVRRGETVTAIARRYGVSVNAVLAVNHLSSRTAIHPGRRLLVPVAANGTRAAATRRAAAAPSPFLGRTYPDAVTRAAAANRASLARTRVPDRARVRELIGATARRYGVDPALALAVASMESGFDQRQVSPANAIGVMQVLPSSGTWASELVDRRLDLLDAEDNITAGVALLATLIRQAGEQNGLAGYYQGLASVRRHGMFADTRRYVATVRTLKLRFR